MASSASNCFERNPDLAPDLAWVEGANLVFAARDKHPSTRVHVRILPVVLGRRRLLGLFSLLAATILACLLLLQLLLGDAARALLVQLEVALLDLVHAALRLAAAAGRQLDVDLAHVASRVGHLRVVKLGKARLHMREMAELNEGDAARLGRGVLFGEQAHADGVEGGEMGFDVSLGGGEGKVACVAVEELV